MVETGPSIQGKRLPGNAILQFLAGSVELELSSSGRSPCKMRLYLDSAEVDDWRTPEGAPPLQGVTTNPSLIQKAGLKVSLESYMALIGKAGERRLGEIMLQAPRKDAQEFRSWLDHLLPAAARLRVRVIIKIPCHPDWMEIFRLLKEARVPVLLTGLSNPMQLMWAQSLGADYVAPYIGRIAEAGRNPWPLIEACIRAEESGVRLVAASVRDLDTLGRLLALGSYAVTLRPEFIQSHAEDDLTLEAIRQFSDDTLRSLEAP